MFVTEVVGQKPEAIFATNLGETQILAGAQLSGSGKRESAGQWAPVVSPAEGRVNE
jgi:hypothetical protein